MKLSCVALVVWCVLLCCVPFVGASEIARELPVLCFTFDDAYQSHYTIAKPYLATNNVKVCFSVPTENVTSSSSARGTFEDVDMMTWNEIKALRYAGHMLASHTDTHSHWSTTEKMSVASVNDECNVSQTLILNKTGVKPYWMCYPYGEKNDTILGVVDDFYVGGWVAGWTSNPLWLVFDYTVDDLTYYELPSVQIGSNIFGGGGYGEYSNGSNTATIKAQFELGLDWLVGNGTGCALIYHVHNIFADVADCRGASGYSDLSEATWEYCMDLAVEYRDVGGNLTIMRIDEVFANRTSVARRADLLMSCVAVVVIGALIVMVGKSGRSY